MRDIFLIMFDDGDYESCPAIIGYALSEEEAEAEVEYRNDIDVEVRNYIEAINKHKKELISKHEAPDMEKMFDIPTWAAGLGEDQITDQMRAERTLIKLKNKQINSANHAITRSYNKKIDFLLEDFKSTIEISADAKFRYINNGGFGYQANVSGYSYQSVQQIV